MRKLLKGIIHCDASNIAAHDDIEVIDGWHKERGFKFFDDKLGKQRHVGYHFYIKSDGTLQYGRPLWKVGAHCKGYNMDSIGICLHGKVSADFTREQYIALADLVAHLMQVCDINEFRPHSYYDSKKAHCPGFNVQAQIRHWRPDLEFAA